MPTIRVTLPTGMWSTTEKKHIAQTLTKGLDAVAQAVGKGEIRPHITVQIMEASEGGYVVGGAVVG